MLPVKVSWTRLIVSGNENSYFSAFYSMFYLASVIVDSPASSIIFTKKWHSRVSWAFLFSRDIIFSSLSHFVVKR